MKMCLWAQQFVALLLYLDDIHVFTVSVDEMLDWVKMVLKGLKDFNLKIKLKNHHFFSVVYFFWDKFLSTEVISVSWEKVD